MLGVVAVVFARFVEFPVRIEVAAGSQCPQLQHRLGAHQPPARAGQLHPVADQVPARPFDHAGGDGIARREVAVVVQIRCILQQVVRARIDRLAGVSTSREK